jgi:uncharacterized membrane protein
MVFSVAIAQTKERAQVKDAAPHQLRYGRAMMVILGVLMALAGLLLVGLSGTTRRQRSNFRLPIGLVLLTLGALVATLGGELQLLLGLAHP